MFLRFLWVGWLGPTQINKYELFHADFLAESNIDQSCGLPCDKSRIRLSRVCEAG
jgi:hypothetical protein